MLLAIDIGNTRTKAAVFEGETLLDHSAFNISESAEAFRALFEKFPNTSAAVLSSVAGNPDFLPQGIAIHRVGRDWQFPFKNLYATPETLGIDRMVLAAGAALMYPGLDALIIDAGTCVTYDFLDGRGRYRGGAISPGLQMRYRSLHDYTARLPLASPEIPESFIGDSTFQSIHSGVVNGLVAEIEAFAGHVSTSGNFIIILTGGDSEFLAGRLKNRIFANPNFLLESLNRLFQYQITK